MEREFSVPLWTHLVKPLLSYQGHRHNLESGGRGGGGVVRGHEKVCSKFYIIINFNI